MGYRFKCYEHGLVIDGTKKAYKYLIFLQNTQDKTDVITTNLHRFLLSKGGIISYDSKNRNRVIAVAKFLNYLFFDEKLIDKLEDLEIDMVKKYLNDYGMCRLNDGFDSRTKPTVESHFGFINSFIKTLAEKKIISIKPENLSTEKLSFNNHIGKITKFNIPAFDVVFKEETARSFQIRDIPNKVLPFLLSIVIDNYPRILMNVALQLFAGLRPGESCNVRRTDSPLGPGIFFTRVNNQIRTIEIDIRNKYILRSDLVKVAGIKRKRMAKVYPGFIDSFVNCYEIYLHHLDGKKYETDYGPLSLNSKGLALTYKNYYDSIKKVTNDLAKVLYKTDDADLISYAQLIQEYGLHPHAFRHWFSVNLTLMGESAETLKKYRGDKNIESSQVYLDNKGDLEKMYGVVSNEVFDYSLWKAGKLNGNY